MAGKHGGARKGAKPKKSFSPALLGLALGVTVLVVAWGYLVLAAVDFGSSARAGRTQAWWFLALASLGAVACLFAGLMLVARILRRLGITSPAPTTTSHGAAGPHGADSDGATRPADLSGRPGPDVLTPAHPPGRRRAPR